MGAVNAGIDFCLYNKQALSLQEAHNPKYIIQNLAEVMSLLKCDV